MRSFTSRVWLSCRTDSIVWQRDCYIQEAKGAAITHPCPPCVSLAGGPPQRSPGVVELQGQVVPVLVVGRDHGLQGAGILAPPAVAEVDHSILASAQLSAQLGLAWMGEGGGVGGREIAF